MRMSAMRWKDACGVRAGKLMFTHGIHVIHGTISGDQAPVAVVGDHLAAPAGGAGNGQPGRDPALACTCAGSQGCGAVGVAVLRVRRPVGHAALGSDRPVNRMEVLPDHRVHGDPPLPPFEGHPQLVSDTPVLMVIRNGAVIKVWTEPPTAQQILDVIN